MFTAPKIAVPIKDKNEHFIGLKTFVRINFLWALYGLFSFGAWCKCYSVINAVLSIKYKKYNVFWWLLQVWSIALWQWLWNLCSCILLLGKQCLCVSCVYLGNSKYMRGKKRWQLMVIWLFLFFLPSTYFCLMNQVFIFNCSAKYSNSV